MADILKLAIKNLIKILDYHLGACIRQRYLNKKFPCLTLKNGLVLSKLIPENNTMIYYSFFFLAPVFKVCSKFSKHKHIVTNLGW